MSWQRKEGGEDAGLKSRFHIGGMAFTLAGAKCTLTTPAWENFVLGKASSFGAVLSPLLASAGFGSAHCVCSTNSTVQPQN